jgi:hypothetical protein
MNPGNNNASGNIDLSGGDINFYLNNNKSAYIHSNGDASFNGHVTIYDLSVINVMTVGTSTTYIDTNDVSTNNLKANNVNAGFVIVDNSLNTSFIYSPLVENLTIQAGSSGSANVEFIANKVIIGDLSVNDICANSINLNVAIFNNITTTDLSVNNHASIFDLSVTNLLNVGDVTITQSQVQTNTLRSTNTNPLTIQGGLGGQNIILQAGTVNMRDNVSLVTISDLSVNDISASQIDVTNIDVSTLHTTINSGKITTTDLSVNNHASIYDLSVINLMNVGNDISLTNGTVTSTLVDCSNISVSNNGRFINDVSVNNILEVGLNTITYDLSVNRHASIYDLSVVNFMTVGTSTTTIDTNSINGTSGYFNDISVNDLSVNSLKVESLEIASQLILQDLSVNNSASFNDVSINTLQVDNIADISNNLTVGNKIIVQDLSVNGLASIYDLSVINLMTVGTSTTTIDTNSINAISGIFDNSLNVNDNFSVNHSTGIIDFSATKVEFNNGLIIEKSSTINTIRVPYNQSQQIKISTGTGGSDGSGSMIIESGEQLDLISQGYTTITAQGSGQNIELSATKDITFTATDVSFIDVSNVYFGNSIVDISDLRIGYRISTDNIVSPNDELKISSLQGMTFLSSGGDININAVNNDISFNADTITFDASVCFLKDPSIKEENYENRELKIYGSSTIIFDISGGYNSAAGGTVPTGTTDLSFVKCIYNDFKPTSLFNSIFKENYIDFSNNQTAVTNFLFEVYLSIKAKFTNQTDALTFQFINVDSSQFVDIDTRSIAPKIGYSTVVFGPVSFVFKEGVTPDFNLITEQWKIAVNQLGTGATIESDPRLTIKMKSIV